MESSGKERKGMERKGKEGVDTAVILALTGWSTSILFQDIPSCLLLSLLVLLTSSAHSQLDFGPFSCFKTYGCFYSR